MPLEFSCPYCGVTTLVEDQFAGHRGPCIGCSREVVVPSISPAQRTKTAAPRNLVTWFQFAAAGLILVVVIGAISTFVVLLAIPMMEAARAQANRNACQTNMKAISAALLAYHRDYDQFPPAVVVDAKGAPLYSWRVLVLPYLGPEAMAVYTEYDLDQAWNGAHNKQLVSRMPAVFNSPVNDAAMFRFETSYMVVTGNGTLFPPGKTGQLSNITDGADETILLVEMKDTGITWTEPRDLVLGISNFQQGVDLGGNHPGGTNVAMADGETKFLPLNVPTEALEALATPAGNDWTGDWE